MDKDDIVIEIKEPWWGAHKEFGWPTREEGYGIRSTLVRQAIREQRNIRIKYKDAEYITTPKAIELFYRNSPIKPIFKTKRGNVTLIVIPRSIMVAV